MWEILVYNVHFLNEYI